MGISLKTLLPTGFADFIVFFLFCFLEFLSIGHRPCETNSGLMGVTPLVHFFQYTGRERLIRSHSSARFSFELSGNSN